MNVRAIRKATAMHTWRIIIFTWLAIILPLLAGCATLISGTEQKIPITSDPSGAEVIVDGNGTFTTPVDLKLARKDEHTLLVNMPGYHSVRVDVKKKLNWLVAGNALFGGLVGATADVASGATNELSPKRVHVQFEPVGPGESASVREWMSDDDKKKKDEHKTDAASAATSADRSGS